MCLFLATLGLPWLEELFRQIAPGHRQVIYSRDSFALLLGNHLLLVGLAALISISLGLASAVFVTRPYGRDFLPLVTQVASMGQTFPPVAVLALAVPLLGFGALPTIMALSLYGLLPIVRNTLVGIHSIDPALLESARGMGMSPLQVLWQVEMPLAANIIIGGIRTSVTINIATAAIGSTIGATTLGDPVISGLVNGNTAYVLQGAILIGLLAVTADSCLDRLQQWVSPRMDSRT
ncbi:Glycine betaine/carnitine/choline ABC transporter, permease protein [Nitrincola lacisaponensis]|uniref:Glycine betaine/carnitine/choline ABC transporter, permease protein n=2 Tax=Nitrincola lacisaponensis TaxID=267850 RepID=A0A063Y407_9GAMM|nr:Glycine betaine/carnitine/choline ABC transporter, permease protein [Nitrincola lacisaponensis]